MARRPADLGDNPPVNRLRRRPSGRFYQCENEGGVRMGRHDICKLFTSESDVWLMPAPQSPTSQLRITVPT